jgi:short-subunit dehydrogenase
MELRGRTALLTGAAGALGGHIAGGLAGEGMNLILSDLAGGALDARTGEFRQRGATVEVVPADLTDRARRASLIEEVEEQAGPVDLLVNNAGVELTAPLTGFTDEEVERLLEVNLHAPIDLTRQVIPKMLERGRGHVVQLASLAGRVGPAWMSTYAISKAGLVAMTQSLRAEHRDDPVGFSAVCPGFVAGEGMVEPLVEAGTEFSATVRPSPPELVPRAVIRAVRKDIPDVVIAHRRPMRLLLAMYALAPKLTERLLFSSGGLHVFRDTAEHRGRL